MEKLYSFRWDCGNGSVTGLFIEEEENVKNIIGKDIYFGEILGKYSEIYGKIEEGEIVEVNISSSAVEELKTALGYDISGYNPFAYQNID